MKKFLGNAIVLLVAGVWLVTSSHCLLENFESLSLLSECSESCPATSQRGSGCTKCQFESAPITLQKARVDQDVADDLETVSLLPLLAVLSFDPFDQPDEPSVHRVEEISSSEWHVYSERALPIRGPSLVA